MPSSQSQGPGPEVHVQADATIGSDVELGPGTVIGSECRLTTNIRAGRQLVMHARSTVSHDARIGDQVTIGASTNVAGNVRIGSRVTLGDGVAVIPGVTIGSDATVEPGAVVLRDVADHTTVAGVPATLVESRPVRGPYSSKRLVDLGLLALLAVPAAIAGLVCAIAVRSTSRGPILFRQDRVGLDERPFRMIKFRTMEDRGDNPLVPDPDRITGVGRWLRRFSLDELPQLLNVARGEMSVVGPRPALAFQLDNFTARQRGRASVRPGLTGLAQVSGRNEITWSERIEFDLAYIHEQSPMVDLRLAVQTPVALLSGEGVEGHQPDDPLIDRS